MFWLSGDNSIRVERHYGDRLFPCYANRPRTISEMFDAVVAATPDAEAIVDQHRRVSYRDLDKDSRRFATALSRKGIKPGDRVVLNLGNGAEFIIALLGAIRLGAIAVPVGSRLRRPELEFIYNNCNAVAAIYDQKSSPEQPTPSSAPECKLQILVGGKANQNEVAFDEILGKAPAFIGQSEAQEDECAVLLYTSGTTGQPKGAMLTHLGIIHSTLHWCRRYDFKAGERTVLSVPASHVTGIAAQIFPMIGCGGCTITMGNFDVGDFLDLVEAERQTFTIMVPAMYNLILMRGDLKNRDFNTWRIGAFGGAPMPEATIRKIGKFLPDLYLSNAYGATEVTSPATIMPLADCRTALDSIGKVVECGDILIMDNQGFEVPLGEIGEIWISGPMVVPKYWNRAEADKDSFVAGYWCSGDIGTMDQDGFLRILDRKKDMINRGGYKIFSAEVENVLIEHPEINEAALVPVPCPVLGERAHAFVVFNKHEISKDDV
ncbi:MAG: class I adenylate-forming enzyme family protein, partial [Sneathiella sp.]